MPAMEKLEMSSTLARVEKSIYVIRGVNVMLDRDLANLYGIETRVLNQAVTRNLERFPGDFMFELTRDEIWGISQFVTSLKYSKSIRAFTEQGVAMLASVLKTRRAVRVNIEIVRTFVRLRKMLETNKALAEKLAQLEKKYDAQFKVVFDAIRQLMNPSVRPRKQIGFHP